MIDDNEYSDSAVLNVPLLEIRSSDMMLVDIHDAESLISDYEHAEAFAGRA
jgi:hypothetical protein